MSEQRLAEDFTLVEAAKAIGMSGRWLRQQIKDGEAGEGPFIEHTRRGHKIMFTEDQVEKLRAAHKRVAPVEQSVTTGRKRGQ